MFFYTYTKYRSHRYERHWVGRHSGIPMFIAIPGPTRKITHSNGSDGQKYGKYKVFQRWLLAKGTFTCRFDDFYRFVGLHQFRHL